MPRLKATTLIFMAISLIAASGCGSTKRINRLSEIQLELIEHSSLRSNFIIVAPDVHMNYEECFKYLGYFCVGGYSKICRFSSPDLDFAWYAGVCGATMIVDVPRDGLQLDVSSSGPPSEVKYINERDTVTYQPNDFHNIGLSVQSDNSFKFDIPANFESSCIKWIVYFQDPTQITFVQADCEYVIQPHN
jgi:hypothetical protein